MDVQAKPSEARDDAEGVRFLIAGTLGSDRTGHGFFLRTGGVSEGFYASLNCGRGSNDIRERVEENRARVAAALGVRSHQLAGPRQVHSALAVIVEKAWQPGEAPEADAAVTNVPGLALSVLTADCTPVLLADAEAGVIAAIHAGWKGAKAGVIENTIEAMRKLGAHASRIGGAIGPTISQRAYEVGEEFRTAFAAENQENLKYFSQESGRKPHFNLPAYVKDKLTHAGVFHVHDTAMCTYENESILFSYRRTCHRGEPDYGRQISAIVLR
jgi:YfiH family protein